MMNYEYEGHNRKSNQPPVPVPPVPPYGQPPSPNLPNLPYPEQTYIPMTPDVFKTEDMELMDDYPSRQLPGDPPPILSNATPVPGTFLLKELTGYPNYGNPSGNADILYTGNRGVWTFNLPFWLPSPQRLRGQILIRAVLDDHPNVPEENYALRIAINGTVVRRGPIALQHGVPAGGRFVNWRVLTYPIPNLRRNNRIVIVNDSTAGPNDWIGLDWMELRLFYV